MIKVIFDLTEMKESEKDLATGIINDFQMSAPVDLVTIETIRQRHQSAGNAPHMSVDRIDFVTADTKCFQCGHMLTSGSAYIVRDHDGKEHACGPKCVEKITKGLPPARIPDFTRGSTLTPGEDGSKAKRKKETAPAWIEEEYLLLRYEKLPGFNLKPFPPLEEKYMLLKANRALSDIDRKFIHNLLAKLPLTKMASHSLENLQTCYAYQYWLKKASKTLQPDKRGYLDKLIEDLQARLSLTPRQIEGANKWLSHLDGMPELDPAPFAWASK
jgi:hypothetical protein